MLLRCGNSGLAGGWYDTCRLVARLAEICAEDAVVVADSVDEADPRSTVDVVPLVEGMGGWLDLHEIRAASIPSSYVVSPEEAHHGQDITAARGLDVTARHVPFNVLAGAGVRRKRQ